MRQLHNIDFVLGENIQELSEYTIGLTYAFSVPLIGGAIMTVVTLYVRPFVLT